MMIPMEKGKPHDWGVTKTYWCAGIGCGMGFNNYDALRIHIKKTQHEPPI